MGDVAQEAPAESGSTEHELKTWPEPFQAIVDDEKAHEIRKADRAFNVGDRLYLREWDPQRAAYTGRKATADVTYITRGGEWGLPADMCVMSIRLTSYWAAEDDKPWPTDGTCIGCGAAPRDPVTGLCATCTDEREPAD